MTSLAGVVVLALMLASFGCRHVTSNYAVVAVTSIAIEPRTAGVGMSVTFIARETFSDGSTASSGPAATEGFVPLRWSTSDSAMATVDDRGTVVARQTGVVTVTATEPRSGASANAELTIASASIVSISLTPPTISAPMGITQRFIATGTLSDGRTKDVTNVVAWSSSDATIATIDASGDTIGTAIGKAAGTVTIHAKDVASGAEGSATFTVTVAVLKSIEVTPVIVTTPIGTTQAFVATGKWNDGTTRDLTTAVAWKSSDDAIATVGAADGMATAIKPGLVTINAADAVSGITGSAALTVTAATLKSISVTPSTVIIPKATTQQYSATGTYSDGTIKDLTKKVTWATSNATVATISNAPGTEGLASGLTGGASVISAAEGAISGSTTVAVTNVTLSSIALTPVAATIPKGTTQQFSAEGTYSDGSIKDLTAAVTWSSGTVSTATVSNASGTRGLVTALAGGTTLIVATDASSGKSGSTVLTVSSGTLVSITITPATPSIPKSTTVPFVATGNYSDASTKDLTAAVTWASSATSVATISNAAGSKGLATGAAGGTTSISASDPASSIVGSTTLKVTAVTLTSIAITPAVITIPKATSQKFVATATYSDASTTDVTTSITWTSSAPATAAISNASGSAGLATAIAAGGSTISAKDPASGIVGSATLTVSSATITALTVTPTATSIPNGTTQQFIATATYSDSTTKDVTSAIGWSTSDATLATVSNAAGMEGRATGLAGGVVTISATDATTGASATATLTVNAVALTSIALTPASPSVPKGSTQQFVATGTYSDGSIKDLTTAVSWSSSSTSIASISNATGSQGLATAVAAGTSTIAATHVASGKAGSTTMTVVAIELVSIEVKTTPVTLHRGMAVNLTAIATYSDASTRDVTSIVNWSSSAGAVASVDNGVWKGHVTALAAGTSEISAKDPTTSTTGKGNVTVSSATLTSVALTPASTTTMTAGTSAQFTALGTYSDAATGDITTCVTWSSSFSVKATVSNAPGSWGLVSALKKGVVSIGATDPATGLTKSTALTITP